MTGPDQHDDELATSLTGLSGLLTGHQLLEQTLVRVAELAVQAIPGAHGAGLTLLEADRPQTSWRPPSSSGRSTTCSTAWTRGRA